MKLKILKYKNWIGIVSVLTVFLFAQSSYAQSVVLEARIDTAQRFIGEQSKITVKVSCGIKDKVAFPSFRDTITSHVDFIEMHAGATQYLNNNQRKEVSYCYIISSIDSGLYYIPPFGVIVNNKKYYTRPLSFKVYSVPVDVKHPNQFYPPKDVMRPPFAWSDWSALVFFSFLTVILVILIVYCSLRLRDNKPILRKISIISITPPDKKALQQIESLKSEGGKVVEQAQQKEYYTALTDALRTYIKDRFGFNAKEMTSNEIIERLMAMKESKDTFNDLKMLFQTADLVKFAKHAAMLNENDYNLVSAVSFINETRQADAPVQKVQPVEYTVEEKRSRKSRMALIFTITVSSVIIGLGLAYIVVRIIDLI